MAQETKLVWNPDNVRDVAESVGISSLNDDAVRALSQETEYRVGQVIVEAMRFMHAGKRSVLGTQDISQALKVLDVEPLYGYESTRPLRFGEASLGPGQPLYYIEDEEVDFEKLINAPLPKVPRDMSFTAHWLAIEGVQPSIAQNPTTAEARASELVPKGPGVNPALAALAGNDNVSSKPLVKHVISKELILFFDKIRAAVLDEDRDPEVIILRESAYESVRSDPGLQQLAPYFVQFVNEKVTHSLASIFVLRQMLELTNALIANETINMEPYVAALVPPILTCLVGRHLGSDGVDNVKDKYDLRDLASSLLGIINSKYQNSSHALRARLIRTCLKHFLDPTHSLSAHYGAINGLSAVGGPEGIRVLVLNNLKPYEYVITKAINERGPEDAEVKMIIAAIVKAVRTLHVAEGENGQTNGTNGVHRDVDMDDGTDEEVAVVEFLGKVIGERIVRVGDRELNRRILSAKEKPVDV